MDDVDSDEDEESCDVECHHSDKDVEYHHLQQASSSAHTDSEDENAESMWMCFMVESDTDNKSDTDFLIEGMRRHQPGWLNDRSNPNLEEYYELVYQLWYPSPTGDLKLSSQWIRDLQSHLTDSDGTGFFNIYRDNELDTVAIKELQREFPIFMEGFGQTSAFSTADDLRAKASAGLIRFAITLIFEGIWTDFANFPVERALGTWQL